MFDDNIVLVFEGEWIHFQGWQLCKNCFYLPSLWKWLYSKREEFAPIDKYDQEKASQYLGHIALAKSGIQIIFFLFLHENICCGFSLEVPLHENVCCGYSFEVPWRGTSNEYP